MDLRKTYEESILQECESLSLLIEFLVLEKKTLTWESGADELDLYFKPNNKKRMNKLLNEYRNQNA